MLSERVETRPCRIKGCPHLTDVVKGRYAGLCAEHRAEVAEEIRESNRGAEPGRVKQAKTNGGATTYEARTRRLLKAAQVLDKAKASATAAIAAMRTAQDDFDTALNALGRRTDA